MYYSMLGSCPRCRLITIGKDIYIYIYIYVTPGHRGSPKN